MEGVVRGAHMARPATCATMMETLGPWVSVSLPIAGQPITARADTAACRFPNVCASAPSSRERKGRTGCCSQYAAAYTTMFR